MDVTALQFHPDGDALKADLEIGVADRTMDGATTSRRAGFTAAVPNTSWEEARKRGIAYQKQWKPAAATATLRVVVHDVRTGNYGTLEVPLSH